MHNNSKIEKKFTIAKSVFILQVQSAHIHTVLYQGRIAYTSKLHIIVVVTMDMDHTTTQDTSPATAAVENDEHGQLPPFSTSFTADAGNLEVSSPPSAGNVVLPVPVANNNLTQNFTESELAEIFGEGGRTFIDKTRNIINN